MAVLPFFDYCDRALTGFAGHFPIVFFVSVGSAIQSQPFHSTVTATELASVYEEQLWCFQDIGFWFDFEIDFHYATRTAITAINCAKTTPTPHRK